MRQQTFFHHRLTLLASAVPYYISVVSPPLEQCPAIISAVRKSLSASVPARTPAMQAAMAASSAFEPRSQRSSLPSSPRSPNGNIFDPVYRTTTTASNPSAATSTRSSTIAPPPTALPFQGKLSIKSEAWVTSSVFCFTISGFRGIRGIKWDLYDAAYPHILLAILHNLDAEYFALVTHIALAPTQRGRDLLIFSSIGPRTVEDRTPSSIQLPDMAGDRLSQSIPSPQPPFEARPQPATVKSLAEDARFSPGKIANAALLDETPRAISPPPASAKSNGCPSKRGHFMRRRQKDAELQKPSRKSDQSWVVLSDDETSEAKGGSLPAASLFKR